jgi:hypothetical protein
MLKPRHIELSTILNRQIKITNIIVLYDSIVNCMDSSCFTYYYFSSLVKTRKVTIYLQAYIGVLQQSNVQRFTLTQRLNYD